MLIEAYKKQLEKLLETKSTRKEERLLAWNAAWVIGAPDKDSEIFRKIHLRTLYESAFEPKELEIASPKQIPGVDILSLTEAKERYGAFFYNRAQKGVGETFFSKINEALVEEGIFIYVPPNTKVKEPILIPEIYTTSESYYAPRIHILVGSGSQVEIFREERCVRDEPITTNQVIDIVLEPRAKCLFIEKQNVSSSSIVLHHLHAVCKKESELKVISANKGSKLLYQSFDVRLLQEGARATLKGVWDLDLEKKSHTNIYISHEAERTFSQQHFKGVLRGHSRSTFEGKIYVHPIAQKTEAYQLNNNLLLDIGASCFTKPNLEIFADDVKASHGATVKDLSLEEMFYMQSRGISVEKGKELLSRGFLDAILKEGLCHLM
jgi:Fe-S cluster assembly protein SufD